MDYSGDTNKFDFSNKIGYNKNNNDVYEVFKMDEKIPLNDPNCQHDLVADESDIMGEYIAYVCRKCNVGHFIPIKLHEQVIKYSALRA